MLKNIEHLGIAVRDLTDANMLFSKLLGVKPYKQEEVVNEGVITSFFKTGETKIELLQATNEHSAIHKYINKKGEGIHHIAFRVDDIEIEVKRLISEGFEPLSTEPKIGADNKRIIFFHPKSTNGILIELCEEIK